MNSPRLTFAGGAGSVTGANFLLETHGKKVLVDCGLQQGTKEQDIKNYDQFDYDPSEIDILLITHAHLDHIGRIGKLVHDGFRGEIYSTIPTREIAAVMMDDAVDLMADQAEYLGKDPMYDRVDVATALSLWKVVDYRQKIELAPGFWVKPYDAGHILGSAQFMLFLDDLRVLFTGDLGNSPSPLLRDTEQPEEVPHYIISESVYGDRNHVHREDRILELERICRDTIERKAVLVIPAFSVERTQELLFELNNMVESGRLPKSAVYVDSPLGIEVTKIYGRHVDYLNDNVRNQAINDNVFSFPGLQFTYSSEESKKINEAPTPKIIIAGSGMSVGGRVVHHERRYLPDENATILLVGYQSPGTLGRHIQEGRRYVTIRGEEVPVRAAVKMITGFSGHKDSQHLQDYLGSLVSKELKTVYCAMGETGSASFLAQKLRDIHGIDAVVPDPKETVVLEK